MDPAAAWAWRASAADVQAAWAVSLGTSLAHEPLTSSWDGVGPVSVFADLESASDAPFLLSPQIPRWPLVSGPGGHSPLPPLSFLASLFYPQLLSSEAYLLRSQKPN